MASSGTSNTLASVRSIPRMSRAWALTTAQVAMPPISTSSSVPNSPSTPKLRLVISSPVATGPLAVETYARRNTWCEGCEL
ncbi:hypothetical protein D9M71_281300 [compost metagenome]